MLTRRVWRRGTIPPQQAENRVLGLLRRLSRRTPRAERWADGHVQWSSAFSSRHVVHLPISILRANGVHVSAPRYGHPIKTEAGRSNRWRRHPKACLWATTQVSDARHFTATHCAYSNNTILMQCFLLIITIFFLLDDVSDKTIKHPRRRARAQEIPRGQWGARRSAAYAG